MNFRLQGFSIPRDDAVKLPCLVLAIFVSIFAVAQETTNAAVRPTVSDSPVRFMLSFVAVAQPEAPVRVLGIERRTGALSPFVTVENVSAKTVKALTVGLAIAAPEGCSPAKHAPVFVTSNSGPDSLVYSKAEIASQQRVVLRAVDMVSSAASTVLEIESRYVQIQLGVTSVQFVDGTTWQRTSSSQEPFAPEILNSDSANCAKWPWIPSALDSLRRGLKVKREGNGRVDTDTEWNPKPFPPTRPFATRYSVTCEASEASAICDVP